MSGRRTTARRWVVALALGGLAVSAARCTDVYLTAPPGSTLDLTANPDFVASHGGVSQVTAFLFEEIGTPVADGTVVFWSTDLGRIDAESRTKNGLARANFVSDSRSGIATVRAFSGAANDGGGGGGGTTTTTTTSSTGSVAFTSGIRESSDPVPGGSSGATLVATGTAVASSATSAAFAPATIQITVGNRRVKAVLLRADPPRITISNSTHVFAVVIDEHGNPVENVPVYFDPGTSTTEFFDFTGPVFTNNNGEAENVLRTRRTTTGVVSVNARATGPGSFIAASPLPIPIL